MALSFLLEPSQGLHWWQTTLLGLAVYLLIHQPNVLPIGFVSIPIIGAWVATYRFMKNPLGVVQQGVKMSKNGMFRISTLQGEYVLVTDRDKVAEYLKAPDSVLNAQDGSNDQQQIPHTMGYGVGHRTYHTPVVKGPITKQIGAKHMDMLDEASLALGDLIGEPGEFTPISLYDVIAMTIARVSNRVYIGTEFCRNEEYLRNASDYAQAVVISAEILRLFPEWSKSFVVRLLPVMKYRRAGERMLRHFIQARLNGMVDENGQSPQDLVQWLIDAAPAIEKSVPQLAERVMALNVASIHTTTMVFTGALYTLAQKYDEYAHDLRKEVLNALEDGKITVNTMRNLPKMESFLRESGRFNNAGLMAMQRNARKEFRFSDGTVLPPGSKVGAPSRILQFDSAVYEDSDEFQGFRFLQPKYKESKESTPTATSSTYHVFGHGRHPCPGRFFAANEMKLLMSLLLLKYDFKLAEGDAPRPFYLATMFIPDTTLKVHFQARPFLS